MRRICSNEKNFVTAKEHILRKAMEAGIPENVTMRMAERVCWRECDVIIGYHRFKSMEDELKYVEQREQHYLKWLSRQSKVKGSMEKGTVVSIQKIYTGKDVNICNILSGRATDTENLITRAIGHNVDPSLAEDISLSLSRLKWVRAKKPTSSIKAIARRTLKSFISSKQQEEKLDHGGAQWRHDPPKLGGAAGRMITMRAEVEMERIEREREREGTE
jgi:hypothetical protein